MLKSRKFIAGVFTSAFMAIGFAGPAAAQPVVTGGLVNITIVDAVDLTNVNVQVPVGIAANVCGVQANVIARGNRNEVRDCTSSTTQDLPVAFRP